MSVPPPIDRYKEEAVPLVFLLIVSVSLFVVPPVALGELGVTLLIPLLILIVLLAVWPYACAVAVGTLPLLYANIASFAAPDTDTDAFHSFSLDTVLRHTVAGFSYVVGAATVSAVVIGIQMFQADDETVVETFQPWFLLGSVTVAVAFVVTQLWRYDRPLRTLPLRIVFGTLILGGLLALSIVPAFWHFHDPVSLSFTIIPSTLVSTVYYNAPAVLGGGIVVTSLVLIWKLKH